MKDSLTVSTKSNKIHAFIINIDFDNHFWFILFTIYIEGVNIRDLNVKAYREQLGCVQQEPILFWGTVTENLRMGKLDATQDENWRSSEASQCARIYYKAAGDKPKGN
ncbi:unnamed protein product [Echinostoma caproni]|uniref:ABC transporter domain-containing protein n=1 Tax=Echinostoma caproni TaxID=27848 RepID=A0A183AWT4_9TREM|nr:unnamed protein product [Echinostoma caproni]